MTRPTLTGTLPNLEAFCATYETGSFTGAARALSVTPQAISRSVSRLEGALGVTLFRRTTRSLAATEEARRYYERCVQAIALLAEGERGLQAGRRALAGRVRLSAGTTYAHHRLLPALGEFRLRYPGIAVEVHVSNHNVSFVRDGHDLAIRMGEIDDAGLVCRRLGAFALGVYASPTYLARHGEPRSVEELERHTCITFLMPRTGRPLPWAFSGPTPRFVPAATYQCSDDFLAAVTLARAGVGLVQAYDFVVEAELARGALVEVLRPLRGQSRPFSLVYPRDAAVSRAARAMIDFIVATAPRSSAGEG
jgi:DNA-binding transcriptional LysR family regulator